MEKLLKILKADNRIGDYKIIFKQTHSYQLFYVSTKLETSRISDSEKYTVCVYVDKEDKRGVGEFGYASYMSEEEVKSNIDEAIFNAGLALNPHYEIPGKQEKPAKIPSNLEDFDFKDLAKEVADAVFSNKMNDIVYSAATEIFLNKVTTRIVNSKGLDNEEVSYFGEIELVPTYDTKEKEVEVYHMAKFSNFDKQKIADEVKENLKLVDDRYHAIDLPKTVRDVNVIIDCDEGAKVFNYFLEDSHYSTKFTKGNLFEVGKSAQGEEIKGDKLNISLAPSFLGCANSRSIDNDGITLKPVQILKDGVLMANHGDNQFGFYLGVKPTGDLPVVLVEPGKQSFKDMHNKPYLRCVRFSNMQIDRTSGLVGGEVRLGYYFDGEKEIPVTGFTFTGNMHELKSLVELSSELETYAYYHGPKYILLPKVSIN